MQNAWKRVGGNSALKNLKGVNCKCQSLIALKKYPLKNLIMVMHVSKDYCVSSVFSKQVHAFKIAT